MDARKLAGYRFFMQCLVSVAVLGLCGFKLVVNESSDQSNSLYWSGLTSIVAWWTAAPGREKPPENNISVDSDKTTIVNQATESPK